MAEFRLSPAAQSDLESIWSYTNEQWGTEQANRYTDKLHDKINAPRYL